MSIDYFVTKFVNFMRYVPYLREEKETFHQFMSCLPQAYEDKIEFLNPKTMDEVIRHAKLCFTQFKQRFKNKKSCQYKSKDKFDPKKQFKHHRQPSHSAPVRRNIFNGQQSVLVHKNNKPTNLVNKIVRETFRLPLECWGCKEPHLY